VLPRDANRARGDHRRIRVDLGGRRIIKKKSELPEIVAEERGLRREERVGNTEDDDVENAQT
jgi:hypothetical protein